MEESILKEKILIGTCVKIEGTVITFEIIHGEFITFFEFETNDGGFLEVGKKYQIKDHIKFPINNLES